MLLTSGGTHPSIVSTAYFLVAPNSVASSTGSQCLHTCTCIFVLMHLDGCPSCLQIDYPDAHLMKPGQRQSYTPTNLERLMALEHEEVQVPAMRGRSFSEDRTQSYSSEASQVSCWQTDKIEVFTIWKCFTKWEVCSDTVNGLIR